MTGKLFCLHKAVTFFQALLSSENRCRAAKTSGNDKDVRIYLFETDTQTAIAVDNQVCHIQLLCKS